jgi:6-phosphogluconolactonase
MAPSLTGAWSILFGPKKGSIFRGLSALSKSDTMASHLIFVGTYTKGTGRGIYSVRLDSETGQLSAPELAAETPSPTFLALSPDKRRLYAVRNTKDMVAGFSVGAGSGSLVRIPAPASAEGVSPCHLAVDRTGRALVVANYNVPIVAALPLQADGAVGVPNVITHSGSSVHPTRQTSAHPHSTTISPDNRFVIACDLGQDRIFTYRFDPAKALLSPSDPAFVATEPGSGPRHFAFGGDGRHAYVINELANTVVAYAYDASNGALAPFQTLSTLPPEFSGESIAAEIRLHPNGRFLYGSNRGHDSIAVFAVDPPSGKLAPVEIMPAGGRTPRNFSLSPDGTWLVCAHQDSSTLCSFRVDPESGRLARVPGTVSVPMPVCVLFYS